MSWSEALWKYCSRPQDFPQVVIKWNDSFVAIYDCYPKSQTHYLVMPRTKIDGIQSLVPDHVPMLNSMKSFASQVIHSMNVTDQTLKMGFHAIPSMKQLHMHVISTDYMGRGLKKKHHYNSFVTDFFLDVDAVTENLLHGKLMVILFYNF
jgi:aprataxin